MASNRKRKKETNLFFFFFFCFQLSEHSIDNRSTILPSIWQSISERKGVATESIIIILPFFSRGSCSLQRGGGGGSTEEKTRCTICSDASTRPSAHSSKRWCNHNTNTAVFFFFFSLCVLAAFKCRALPVLLLLLLCSVGKLIVFYGLKGSRGPESHFNWRRIQHQSFIVFSFVLLVYRIATLLRKRRCARWRRMRLKLHRHEMRRHRWGLWVING